MPHLRTKRKPNSKNIGRLIFSVVVVFILMFAVFSMGQIFNGLKLKMNAASLFGKDLSQKEKINTENTWTLQSDSILMTDKGYSIFVQTANTSEARKAGLSGKEKLKFYEFEDKILTEGMLFLFDNPGLYTIWMKDMNFDLDMIWLDEGFKIVHIEENVSASSYNKENPDSSKLYSNNKDLAKYVLEIDSGMVRKMDLKVGDILNVQ